MERFIGKIQKASGKITERKGKTKEVRNKEPRSPKVKQEIPENFSTEFDPTRLWNGRDGARREDPINFLTNFGFGTINFLTNFGIA